MQKDWTACFCSRPPLAGSATTYTSFRWKVSCFQWRRATQYFEKTEPLIKENTRKLFVCLFVFFSVQLPRTFLTAFPRFWIAILNGTPLPSQVSRDTCAPTAGRRWASCAYLPGFCAVLPHTAELQWQGSCNLALVFRLHLSKQFIYIHSLTLDYTWHFKSIMFENVLPVICEIGEAGRAGFPKIARQRSLLSTCFFNAPLVCTSISYNGCSTSAPSRAMRQRLAASIFWVLYCTVSSCDRDFVHYAPHLHMPRTLFLRYSLG